MPLPSVPHVVGLGVARPGEAGLMPGRGSDQRAPALRACTQTLGGRGPVDRPGLDGPTERKIPNHRKLTDEALSRVRDAFFAGANASEAAAASLIGIGPRYAWQLAVKHGWPHPVKGNTEDAFWQRIDKGSDDECWPWLGSLDRDGYGQRVRFNGARWRPHRLAYLLTKGDLGDLCVMHSCDNPRCCNPSHLSLGTIQDNNRDKQNKGRQVSGDRCWARLYPDKVLRGENVGNAKYSDADVEELRRLYDEGGWSFAALARRFGMSDTHAEKIAKRQVRARRACG